MSAIQRSLRCLGPIDVTTRPISSVVGVPEAAYCTVRIVDYEQGLRPDHNQ